MRENKKAKLVTQPLLTLVPMGDLDLRNRIVIWAAVSRAERHPPITQNEI